MDLIHSQTFRQHRSWHHQRVLPFAAPRYELFKKKSIPRRIKYACLAWEDFEHRLRTALLWLKGQRDRLTLLLKSIAEAQTPSSDSANDSREYDRRFAQLEVCEVLR
ncbi:unnamed protein product [Protopolystoma xenopodis]|uniref:Uncharacterized protein n=1 Tax=Protopolystoma xenopodis TaxID=117903 RepID=A0A3S5BDS6_9PLAT|nr:unnamed protein product [Protopolystoma xenopodis]